MVLKKDAARCQIRKEEIDGEEELAAPDWRVRAGPRSKPTQRERERSMKQHTYRFETGAHTA